LLPAEAHYKERLFTQFQLRNLKIAKDELRRLLETAEQVLFDDAWAKVMQYSAVMEGDFRDWLIEWKASGLLSVVAQQPRQKPPRKGENQYLKWIKR